MLGNIAKNSLLLYNKGALFKRYNVPQITHGIRIKWILSKNQSTTADNENDDPDQPIKYSTSKAATMRIDEYRDPLGDYYPWYQGHIISICTLVFLGYFCILREENDIDMLLDTDLEETLNRARKEHEEKERLKRK